MREWINIVASYFYSQQYLVSGDYIVTSYFHYRQYLRREWLHRDIVFSFPTIFGQGVNISWHIFIPHNIWWRGEYIVTLYFHSPQYLVRGEYIVTYFNSPQYLVRGDYIVTLYFHSPQYLVRGDYIVTLYFHSWQYLVRSDYIVTLFFHSW